MSPAGFRRFYKTAAAEETENGHTVTLDGRAVRTPLKAPFMVPTQRLAEAIAGEWASQGEKVDARSMPLMGFASTAIDRVMPRRGEVIEELAAYARTDLLCYRAEAPPELAARQEAAWQPHLDWLAKTHGARLAVTSGVVAVDQDEGAVADVRAALAAHDDFRLTGLHVLTTGTGSVVLGLAVAEGYLDAATAAVAGHLDEVFQAERWGADPLAIERRERVSRELVEAERFMDLLLAAA